MNILIEIVKIAAPSLVTGIFTFLITKYSYNRNIPLDKLEVSYNRVYYPIIRLINGRDDIDTEVLDKCETYFRKYEKYVDKSTLMAFRYLKNNIKLKKAKTNFNNNIYAMDIKLRRRLGYPEPNIFNVYTYANPFDKRLLRVALEMIFCDILAIVYTLALPTSITRIVVSLFAIILLMFIVDVFIAVIQMIYKKVIIIFSKQIIRYKNT